jgi:hypothetical protein
MTAMIGLLISVLISIESHSMVQSGKDVAFGLYPLELAGLRLRDEQINICSPTALCVYVTNDVMTEVPISGNKHPQTINQNHMK